MQAKVNFQICSHLQLLYALGRMKRVATRRKIPAVEKILQALGPLPLPRPLGVQIVRRELAAIREKRHIPDVTAIVDSIQVAIQRCAQARLQSLINATGVVLHTNLGRAPLSDKAVEALQDIGANYSNLELDLPSGERGGRAIYLEELLALVCRSEAATVVNNCAAALILLLRHFNRPPRSEVIVSRGELIQIGGGFRIPEILEASGCRLREVGTTNRTGLADYTRAITQQTALILKVHRSNFFMRGFVESPSTQSLAELARRKRVPFIEDLGSGALVPTENFNAAAHEPTPAEVLQWGVDLVCFSGDKLLGGPQAGIIAGAARRIAALRRDPFFRALRCDKLIIGALQATAESYLAGTAMEDIPALALVSRSLAELNNCAKTIVAELHELPVQIEIRECVSRVGGGTLPHVDLPSVAVDLIPEKISVTELSARLRQGSPPVLGYIVHGRVRLDLRTVFSAQTDLLMGAIRRALNPPIGSPAVVE